MKPLHSSWHQVVNLVIRGRWAKLREERILRHRTCAEDVRVKIKSNRFHFWRKQNCTSTNTSGRSSFFARALPSKACLNWKLMTQDTWRYLNEEKIEQPSQIICLSVNGPLKHLNITYISIVRLSFKTKKKKLVLYSQSWDLTPYPLTYFHYGSALE